MSERDSAMMLDPLPTVEDLIAETHAREAANEADIRRGIIAGKHTRYCYIGPPLPRTSAREIERWWFQMVERRVTCRADVWLRRTEPPEPETTASLQRTLAALYAQPLTLTAEQLEGLLS